MIRIRAPLPTVATRCECCLRRLHDVLRRALGAFNCADGLLGENGGRFEFLESRIMPRRREPEPVTEAERLLKPEWNRIHSGRQSMNANNICQVEFQTLIQPSVDFRPFNNSIGIEVDE